MHSDDERSLTGPIVSISLGAERFFDLIYKNDGSIKHRITLKSGSMIIMDGITQNYWKHGIPIQRKISDTRINITFRIVS